MGEEEGPEQRPHPGLIEAEQRVRAAIDQARRADEPAALALRHAELGMILSAMTRHGDAVPEFLHSLGYIDQLRLGGEHEEQRLLRMSSPAAPPPGSTDIDLNRLEGEVRVALVEALAASGDLRAARHELPRAQPFTKGFFRRRLRRRLDRVAGLLAADPATQANIADVQRHLTNTHDPVQQRALRLRLASAYLDAGELDAATRESLMLVRTADEAGDAVTRAGARQVLGLALEEQGRSEEALAILSDAFRDLRNAGQAAGMIGMAEALAQRLVRAGDPSGAATVLRTTEQAAVEAGDRNAELSLATMLGVVLDESGDGRGAAEGLLDVASRAERYGEQIARADALHSAAVALGRSPSPDDLVEALALLEEAKRIYADHDRAERIAGCEHEAAALLGRHHSHAAASARYESALRAYEDLPAEMRDTGAWPDEIADCRANLAWLHGDRSSPPDGLFRTGGHTMSHSES